MDLNDLSRLETALEAGVVIPSDLASELKKAIYEFKTGQSKTLCEALGLRAVGQSSIATRQKQNQRNRMFIEIAAHYSGDLWAVAGTIAQRLRRWPHLGDETPLYAPLFAIGAKIPNDQSTIFKILNQSPSFQSVDRW